MQSSTLFVLACILLSAQASRMDDIFEQAGQSEYAQSLVATIQLQMESGESVDGLIDSMRGVQMGLKDQLADAEAVHEANGQSCDDDLRGLAAEYTQAGMDIAKFSVASEFDQTTLASRKEELKNKKRELKDRKQMMKVLREQREVEHEAYQNLKEEYDSVFGVVEDCRAIIQSRLVAGESFLESKTSIQSAVLEKLNAFVTPAQGVAHSYGAFFKLLAQVVEKSMEVHADQAVVQRLFDIMDRIEENMEMAQQMERDAERTRAADFVELRDKVKGQIRDVKAHVLRVASEIMTLQARVDASNDKMAIAEERLADFEVRLDDRGAECSSEQQVWESFYNNISEELAVVGKIMYLLEDKRSLLARYGL